MNALICHFQMGGRQNVENETLFRFTFPEKVGALKHFLKDFQPNWNVSLFHHRHQVYVRVSSCLLDPILIIIWWLIQLGNAFFVEQGILTSDVLIGVQLEKSEEKKFHEYAKKVGYQYEVISQDDSAQVLAKL